MIWIYRAWGEPEPGKNKRKYEHEEGMRLLKRALKEQYGIELEDDDGGGREEFTLGPHGKPYLKRHPGIYFNISHCRGLVCCAVGDCEVGIDAEPVRPCREALFKKVLSREEWCQMEEAAEAMRPELFFRFWTLKESYVKAVGCGITIPLKEISFQIGTQEEVRAGRPGWNFWQQKTGDYVISVCMAGTGEIHLAGQEETH